MSSCNGAVKVQNLYNENKMAGHLEFLHVTSMSTPLLPSQVLGHGSQEHLMANLANLFLIGVGCEQELGGFVMGMVGFLGCLAPI